MQNGNNIYLAPTPNEVAVRALPQIKKAAQPQASFLEGYEIPALIQSLTKIPVDLAELRKHRVSVLKAKSDAKAALDMAARPIRTIAMVDGKNREQREALAEEGIANDPNCQRAQKHLDALQYELDNMAVDIQALEERFTAARYITDLIAGQLQFMAK